jgi:outer membrane protein assembly factor BamD (BamD/ComL family)
MKPMVLISLTVMLIGVAANTRAQESFRVELGRDGETIADMRPVFLEFESRPMPAISPMEVARRYQRLFDQSDEPEVRIDALNRLSNIQNVTDEDVSFSEEREQQVYRQALESYESILDRGAYQGRLDELLYQMAKAHAYTGQAEQSIDRLRQLVGLYPSSSLVPEARFRIAEAAFSAGDHAMAESEYSRVISGDGADGLKTKARYMQGWSQFKQGRTAWPRAGTTFLAVLDGFGEQTNGFRRIPVNDAELIDDTFRIVALMAAGERGVDSLASWLGEAGGKDYGYLLYDRLADYYASNRRYEDSVAVNNAFVRDYEAHNAIPAVLAQNVDVWRMAGRTDLARAAKAEYVRMFSGHERYQQLATGDKERWRNFSRSLADYHYDQAEEDQTGRQVASFRLAADYYSQLADRSSQEGEVLRLAGDAFLQAGNDVDAFEHYQQAAYNTTGYLAAADAAWAAILIQRDALDGRNSLPVTIDALASAAGRFATEFPEDLRQPGLAADVSNRMLAQNRYADALRFAEGAIAHPSVSAAQRYSAWVAAGESHVAMESYGLAENAWRQSLTLLAAGQLQEAQAKDTDSLQRQLASSIYYQGEKASSEGRIDTAVAHFQRIESALPGSDIAIKGRYDAANTLLKAERWQAAINELTRFREDYPQHELTRSLSEKLVFAYQSSGQLVRAADEIMGISGQESPSWDQQLRAAELYHKAEAHERRNRIYVAWLSRDSLNRDSLNRDAAGADNSSGHIRNQTLRQRLVLDNVEPRRYRIELVERELASQWHSEDTLAWAGRAAIVLGAEESERFADVPLQIPLAQSLTRKQAALSAARERLSQAEKLVGEGARSEILFRRAELYRVMAQDLMTSEAPANLGDLEATQYRMLLEEEAYPFEEKAIDLHAKNHQRLAEGRFDEWVERSLQVLADLFPGRYDREVRWMTWNEEVKDDA